MSEAIAPAPKNQPKTTIKTTIIANSIHHMGVGPKDTNQQQKNHDKHNNHRPNLHPRQATLEDLPAIASTKTLIYSCPAKQLLFQNRSHNHRNSSASN